jgi:hypothetical protein
MTAHQTTATPPTRSAPLAAAPPAPAWIAPDVNDDNDSGQWCLSVSPSVIPIDRYIFPTHLYLPEVRGRLLTRY